MMETFSQWLLSITAVTLLVALAEALMPQGAVKQVGKVSCGLLLFLMLVKPFASLSPEKLAQLGNDWSQALQEESEVFKNDYDQQIKTIIEQELASYIVDKATEAGILCEAVVECQLLDIYTPIFVEIYGAPVDGQDFLTTMIVEDLGVSDIYFIT